MLWISLWLMDWIRFLQQKRLYSKDEMRQDVLMSLPRSLTLCAVWYNYPNESVLKILILPLLCLTPAAGCHCCTRLMKPSLPPLRLPPSLCFMSLQVYKADDGGDRKKKNVLTRDVLCRFAPQKYTPGAKNGAGLSQETGGGWSLNKPSQVWFIWTPLCSLTVCPSA